MMQKRHLRRPIAFALMTAITAMSLLAAAQNKKGQPSSTKTTAPAKKGTKPAPSSSAKPAPADESSEAAAHTAEASKDAGSSERAPSTAAASGAAGKGGVVEQKTLDGGSRVFRFGEVEVEGRLKSPQIVYFLRRVRAEFAAGDLGHRTFMRELGETRNEPAFE
ncbi:hypothetical protein AKJ09_03120 [Labilithrix luteola]|uniref:Uncharacterized protein n=1 Tax=Labilithrix luteola TaxID=1391654 RepID=A0A0K1PSV8_9BACT|nr:hypothetical protein [Labilithrix luteola]AKU96456.1 hypothetical protein AKJ09_03120 [Labilithrix luteola]